MNLAKVCCATLIWATIVPPLVAKPMPSGRPTAAELPALPAYCQARFGTDEAARKAYSQKLGPKHYQHIHHHCIGLNLLNRSRVTFDKKLRKYYLQDAVRQFNYVLERWPQGFPLTAEAVRGKGTAEMLLQGAS
jgi:hypothetical protein